MLAALREWLEQHKDKVSPGRSQGESAGRGGAPWLRGPALDAFPSPSLGTRLSS